LICGVSGFAITLIVSRGFVNGWVIPNVERINQCLPVRDFIVGVSEKDVPYAHVVTERLPVTQLRVGSSVREPVFFIEVGHKLLISILPGLIPPKLCNASGKVLSMYSWQAFFVSNT
jgi:hypothetical protein